MSEIYCGDCSYFEETPVTRHADGMISGGETYCMAPKNRKRDVKDGSAYGWKKYPDEINKNFNCKWYFGRRA